ncbi:MAG: hypothetical protein C4532_02480 [Candidatus Abyssobacteria bacterium SURF_17]|uniref:Pilus formation protein N-terminal domain-containing protein n=1 Tax=Candidatus Abyssobacteria bacterium SURF_17 TaxID=2093361 RepID=A0A419F7M9_9BACT|nr:MAG: hypothetical protein C4532_02480 [Candidatus Abyssubacteria bacterium SURF_17]
MKRVTFVFMLILPFLVGSQAVLAESAGKANAISVVKLSEGALPLDMSIAREVWASPQELLRVRLRIGFPINALLNQTIVYVNQQAQVNYILPINADWLEFGYTKLVVSDGARSLILPKDGVIIQIAATTSQLQELVAHAFQADPIHYHKIRTTQLPEGWSLVTEEYLPKGNISELERNLNGKIRTALVQEFIVRRLQIKVKCFHCDSDRTAEELADLLNHRHNPIVKTTAESSGSVVVSAESQDEELNSAALALANLKPNEVSRGSH